MMQLERLILYVLPGREGEAAAGWALALARRLGARVFAVHAVDDREQTAGDQESEEAAWKILYEVEDDAFEEDVKLSLVLEQGDPVERLVEVVAGYSGDLVVVPAGAFPPAELVRRSPAPVVFVGSAAAEAARGFKEE
ncbi:MAG TPA: universal stress protein [candidate division WOR-3 bacterium]|uniref:Universal stress protein n=1 Tax=candidate division WOR-3 bacterium TaxID=2052148 RepID=A0A7V0XFI4_UNCW3|nr:universal stress protein [candidate division WOR-3 bacterium]